MWRNVKSYKNFKGYFMKYEIKGGSMPVVECHLDSGEAMTCEKGSMVWMSRNMKMETKSGGVKGMFSKAMAGESLFQNIYRANEGPGMITFGSSFVGSIVPVEIGPGREVICQKSAFLCATEGIELKVSFQKKLKGGMFGGEGFVMQKISGSGTAFLEIDGSAIEYVLGAGEQMIIDTGYLAIMDSTCTMDVEMVKGGIKNIAFGGEGLFNTVVTGPGKISVQTMPKSAFIGSISQLLPTKK